MEMLEKVSAALRQNWAENFLQASRRAAVYRIENRAWHQRAARLTQSPIARAGGMKTAIFRERLGHISTDLMQRCLGNPSSTFPLNCELIRSQSPRGFEVIAAFEKSVRDTADEQAAFMTGATGPEAPKKLIRLLLEPL
jgi:hypothetical protein